MIFGQNKQYNRGADNGVNYFYSTFRVNILSAG